MRYVWHLTSDSVFWPTIELTAQRFAPSLRVPDHFLEQLLAIEDKRYLVHSGVDLLAMARAALANLFGGAELEGASTITQQLYDARRELVGAPRPRTLGRKLRQATWALRESRRSSKLAVLREYLGIVYWGRSYHGLDAAAEGYFRTERQDVTPAQSFFLAERIASPNVVYLGRLQCLLQRTVLARFFDDEASRAELISLYDEHFGCGPELERALLQGRPSGEPVMGVSAPFLGGSADGGRVWSSRCSRDRPHWPGQPGPADRSHRRAGLTGLP